MPEIRKRIPGIEKKISEIKPESDVRVRILGTVIGLNNNSIVIDDGTGKIEINFDEQPSYINQGQLVRVITRVLPLVDGFDCRGECIQVLDNFDVKLYRTAKEIIKR